MGGLSCRDGKAALRRDTRGSAGASSCLKSRSDGDNSWTGLVVRYLSDEGATWVLRGKNRSGVRESLWYTGPVIAVEPRSLSLGQGEEWCGSYPQRRRLGSDTERRHPADDTDSVPSSSEASREWNTEAGGEAEGAS
jgi:hypothetical protein